MTKFKTLVIALAVIVIAAVVYFGIKLALYLIPLYIIGEIVSRLTGNGSFYSFLLAKWQAVPQDIQQTVSDVADKVVDAAKDVVTTVTVAANGNTDTTTTGSVSIVANQTPASAESPQN